MYSWEQRKLGEFVKIISGDAPSTFISGNCIYVKVDDLNYSDRIQLSSSNMVNANPKAHLVNKGATIFPKRGAAIMTNKVRIMGKDGYLDTNMMALIPEEIDKDFLFTFIQKTGLYKIADTSTIPQINNKHIEPYMIQVPSEKEQAYIGVVFEKIDKIITLHQQEPFLCGNSVIDGVKLC
ncbi:restriction endonuclease subunit S [uncultured Veillonella sp.]|uniref:restriction endonuclease subunit S n=1 Tax=uncultured Veillonella sp. TaxID=159268 RepID=UPI0028061B90|nr:restriction endonuclease subunit S [uncultured Veillonella sp.]